MKNTLFRCVREAGDFLLKHFRMINRATRKENLSNVVTATDFASEKLISKIIRRQHPDHNLLGEESGIQNHGSDMTWVIDPLDGTSNFVAGLPWFGVMIAVLKERQPVMAAMYLPVTDTLYFAEKGKGVLCKGKPLRSTRKTELSNALCTYGMDAAADTAALRKQTRMMTMLVAHARNVRLTNCLLDFCFTLDGRIGACVNLNCKVWDIAPACLMFPEAGGIITDLRGRVIELELGTKAPLCNYAVVGGYPTLHKQVLALARKAGL